MTAPETLSHEQRTADEPRDRLLRQAILARVTDVNDRIKTFRFAINDSSGINFKPGQWLDLHIPGIDQAGGFSITSSPRYAVPDPDDEDHIPFFELAVMRSPDNPAAAWLWQPPDDILGHEVDVRVGGSFVWPPPGVDMSKIKRAIFVAGGVGINPLRSMLAYLNEENTHLECRLLYSTKVPSRGTEPGEVLFLPELLDLFRKPRSLATKDRLELFFTDAWDGSKVDRGNDEPIYPLMSLTLPQMDSQTQVPISAWTHRIEETALSSAVGKRDEAPYTVFYVCGPPAMADYVTQYFHKQPGVAPEHVFCEKWW